MPNNMPDSLSHWLSRHLTEKQPEITPLRGGWSARRIYRVNTATQTLILVDSSAERQELQPFVAIARALADHQVQVPEIVAVDFELAYLLETDFGDISLFSELTASNATAWYQQAIHELQRIQQCRAVENYELPCFDEPACRREWNFFVEYYLQQRHQVSLEQHQALLDQVWQLLFNTMQEQPTIFVHRDYHSQNLLILANKKLAVIDFQGAKWGPITYDLVSLLKDCYIDWPTHQVMQWVKTFQPLIWQSTHLPAVSNAQFQRWFDLTGLQRHLKVLGQMAHNIHTDPNFPNAKDLPRVEKYVLAVCERYAELNDLGELLKNIMELN